MDKLELLERIKAVIAVFPTFAQLQADRNAAQDILAQGYALLRQYRNTWASEYRGKLDALGIELVADGNLAGMRALLAMAVADISIEVNPPKQVFGPNAVYDFYRELRKLLSSAKQEVFFIDPYVDDEVFDLYIGELAAHLRCRVLIQLAKSSPNVPIVASKVRKQRGVNFELRDGGYKVHDRVVFVDDACWTMGQSVKDAAAGRPAYLAPLSSDVVAEKKGYYEAIWTGATKI